MNLQKYYTRNGKSATQDCIRPCLVNMSKHFLIKSNG